MNFAKARFLLVYGLVVIMLGCEHNSIEVITPIGPKITKISAPQIIELPRAVKITCEVENPDSLNLQFKWETSSGIIDGDSSTVFFLTPTVQSEVTVTCTISDSNLIFDKMSIQISVIVPAFVGNYDLKTLIVCDSTYIMNTQTRRLIWQIFDTHTNGKGFAYSWKVSSSGLPNPDSCNLQMPRKTLNGFMGKWLRGGSTDADSLIFFSVPVQLGYFTRIIKWSKKQNQLIIGVTQTERWIFEER